MDAPGAVCQDPPEARHRMREILDFWFPFGNLAEVFAAGLTQAGFAMDVQPEIEPDRDPSDA